MPQGFFASQSWARGLQDSRCVYLQTGVPVRAFNGDVISAQWVLVRLVVQFGRVKTVLRNILLVDLGTTCQFQLVLGSPWLWEYYAVIIPRGRTIKLTTKRRDGSSVEHSVPFADNNTTFSILSICETKQLLSTSMAQGEFLCLTWAANGDTTSITSEFLCSGVTLGHDSQLDSTGGSTESLSVERKALIAERDSIIAVKLSESKLVGAYRQRGEEVVREHITLFDELQRDDIRNHGVEHIIETTPGAVPPARQPYRLAAAEEAEMKSALEKLIALDMITPSNSQFSAPDLFVKKKDGKLRMCIDYRGLNKITVKDAMAMPRIEDLLDRMHGAKYFTNLDCASGYHQIPVRAADQHKTAFATKFGHYQFKVMSFGLSGAPATFTKMMTKLLGDLRSVSLYLDDVAIFSDTADAQLKHVYDVLSRLDQAGLKCQAQKCNFYQTEMLYLGHVVSHNSVRMDSSKITVVRDWKAPTSVTLVKSFLGFCNYYRRYIHRFADIARPLTQLTRADTSFCWGTTEQAAFVELKTAMCTAPVLIIFKSGLPVTVVTDASDHCCGATLMQDHGNGLQPIAFRSHNLSPAECKWAVWERECWAIVSALTHWRPYTYGNTVHVITDHKPLIHLMEEKKPTPRQARWIVILQEYMPDITHAAGESPIMAGPDAFSRPLLRGEELFGLMHTSPINAVENLRSMTTLQPSQVKQLDILKRIEAGTAAEGWFVKDKWRNAGLQHLPFSKHSSMLFKDRKMYILMMWN